MAKKTAEKTEDTGILKATAATLGGIVGKVAALAKSARSHEATPKVKASGKLPKKNKSRLPRRQKKLLAKKNSAETKAASRSRA